MKRDLRLKNEELRTAARKFTSLERNNQDLKHGIDHLQRMHQRATEQIARRDAIIDQLEAELQARGMDSESGMEY